ncbi:MAG: Crp/Fnr family transcriptional regulator [Spirochaetaceae bacterium]|nr:MAG: Crp/Fnr family transcriptional regulator [Spirochaetaceae bacterium]
MQVFGDDFWRRAQLFHGVDAEERKRIESGYPWAVKAHRGGELVALMGDPIERLSLITTGSVRAEVIEPQGVLIIETLETGALLAGPVLFAANARFPVQLRAVQDCAFASLPRSDALRLLSKHPAVLENILREGGEKILFLAEKIRLIHFASMREKVAGHFLKLSKQQGRSEIRLTYTLETLAELFGVTRPALSRCLAKMVDDGTLVRLPGKSRYRVSPSRLERIIDGS